MNNFFFCFDQGEIILVDVLSNEQWSLDSEAINFICQKYLSSQPQDSLALQEFLQEHDACVIDTNDRSRWQWGILCWLFHQHTKLNNKYEKWQAELIDTIIQAANTKKSHNTQLLTNEDKENTAWANYYVETNKHVSEKARNNYHYPPVDIALSNHSCSSELESLFHSRFTSRSFINQSMPLECLDKLLFHCVRFREADAVKKFYKESGMHAFGYYRSSPSGGALQSIEVYVIIHNVKDILPGVYLYNPIEHGLTKIKGPVSHQKIKKLLTGQPFAENSAVNICFVCKFNRLWVKYSSSRIYRMAHIETGHLSENIFLYAHRMKQDVFITGAFLDDAFAELLQLDEHSAMMFFMAIGQGEHASFPRQYFSDYLQQTQS